MSKKDKKIFEYSSEITKIANRAVRKAQEESRKLGIPNVYSKQGQIYYELPDGTITTEKPDWKSIEVKESDKTA